MNIAILGERHLERNGSYPAVIFADREVTNAALLDEGRRFATALRELGVVPGDRVAVMLPNMPQVTSCYGAILRTGGVIVPILFLLAVPEVAHILADCAPKAIITSPEFLGNVLAARAGLAHPPAVIVVGAVQVNSAPGDHLTWEQAIDHAPFEEIIDRAASDLAVISYTSGTTGRPKGVALTHENQRFNAQNTAPVTPSADGDVSLLMLPLAHLFGISSMLVGQLYRITSVILPWFTAEGVFDAVTRYRITGAPAVPTMLSFLMAHPGFDDVDWSSLQWVVASAAPVPLELAAEFERRTGARVLEAYGQTEASPTVTIMRLEDERRPGSCGRAVPNIELAILDDDRNPVPTGESGEVCVRGPNVMAGYYGLPEATAETVREGWLLTGDIGHLDEDGFLFITERKKDLIIRGGFNIYPRDVEEALYAHPAVSEAGVVGVPHATLGEEVLAFIVLRPGAEATEQELLEHCRARLAKYKTPSHVVFTDALPKNPVGKILKRELRAMVPAGLPEA